MLELDWNPEIAIGDALTLMGFLFTLTGLLVAVLEIRRNQRIQRAQFLLEITERYFSDREVREFFYKLDYNKFRFDEQFIGSTDEVVMDGLLYTFDTIGRIVRMRMLEIEEVEILAFQAKRTLNNPEVRKYLAWLDNEYKKFGGLSVAHGDARFLIQELNKK